MSAVQTYTYKISAFQTDASGQLFVYQLLNLLQDAAHMHADGFGFGQKQLVRHDLFWVLSRLTIEILSLPEHGDKIILSTWVKSIRGTISEREFSVARGDESLINASSLWFCLSSLTNKPARLPGEYGNLMEIEDAYATANGSEKVISSEKQPESSNGTSMTARYSDIDMVDHVNNATYMRWMMDEIPESYHQHKTLVKLNINYLGQAFLGEEVGVSHSLIQQSNLLHEITNSGSKEVICRAQSIWQN